MDSIPFTDKMLSRKYGSLNIVLSSQYYNNNIEYLATVTYSADIINNRHYDNYRSQVSNSHNCLN